MKYVIAFLLSALVWIPSASANLIVNGSFDQFEQQPTRSWSIYQSLVGWETTAGAGIEVGRYSLYTGSSVESDNPWVVELDSRNNSAMTQVVDILEASYYELSFSYAARTNRADDNVVNVSFDPIDSALASFNETKSSQQGWQSVNYEFWLAPGEYSLTFQGGGISNSYGGLIDAVSLIDVEAPATPLLAGIALFGLMLSRRVKR
ncbi:DUF642 domain-containing protein [Corallincola platygyrae]|uniref:DUF642 domain-containing protein n=1 Tax=Corallincola platygyrae TaxID=1193278 RepID=A0ABW4XKJ6_9GAMM